MGTLRGQYGRLYGWDGGRTSRSHPTSGEIVWDGRDSRGRVVSSGVYYLRLRDETGTRTVRVVKLPPKCLRS